MPFSRSHNHAPFRELVGQKAYSPLCAPSIARALSLTAAALALTAVAHASNYQHARQAVYQVFGPYAAQAMRVAGCETGGTYSPTASNGQYQGIFQMGSWERSRYGHGSTWLEQARAAYRYFVATGHDWSPWTCRP